MRLRRFLRAQRGNVAVEFAMIGPMLLLMLFMIIDVSLALAGQHALDNAVADEARKIEIGAITSTDLATFKSDVCGKVGGFVPSCSTMLQVYVTSGSTFKGLTKATVTAGTMSPQTFNPGNPSDNVLVEVAYQRTTPFGFLAKSLSSSGETLFSVVTLKNEPFS